MENTIISFANKYNFHILNIGDEKMICGKYNLIRVAAKTYSIRHNIKVIAIKTKTGAQVKRIY